ncbi:MAG: von Willebrand factor type A domain-containing protein [Chloroflexi bacterium]|nr:von Willebrand factor type A domain-containing protein [Chloroflexota bacterium]
MARNERPDQEMEGRLREHFAEEAEELRAPDDLWARLESRLGEQQPPRFASLRGGVAAISEMPWIPAAAAAVLVVGVGIGAWALAGGGAGSGGDDDDTAAAPAYAVSDRDDPQAAATQAAATQAAMAAATEATTEVEAAAAAPEATAVAREQAERVQPAPTEAPAATPAPTQAAEATQAPQATTATPEPEPSEPDPVEEGATSEDDSADDGAVSEPGEPDADDMADAGMDMADGDYDDMADEMAPESGATGGGPSEPRLSTPEPPEQPPATTFRDYERTGIIETSTDAVSTFSLDTDRTSYFLALTWVRDGYPVNPDSVRAEEWINSFDYDYAGPGDERSFAITSNLVLHPLEPGWHLARIAMQAPELRDDAPLNVTLVLDASGSMASGNRVAIARAAAEAIRQSLGPDDRIAVVHFTDTVLDAYTVEHSAPDDGDVAWSIERLNPHYSTNVQAGLNLGVELAAEARRERPDAFNYIILMSDGVANVDATDPFAILETAQDSDTRNPLRLITIGVGIENYNDYLLEQLAQHGNGWYRYLDTPDQAQRMFTRENWLALSTPFADQARAQVTWDPAVVRSWRIVGYENRVTPDHTFEQDRKEFAELPSGAATTVFYELQLHEGVSPSAVLGSVEVRWVDPRSGESRSQSTRLAGVTHAGFGTADQYLRLGAIVGLAADRYSALSPQVENAEVDYGGILDDLETLRGQLDALRGSLGSTQAYDDMSLVLKHLTRRAAELAPPDSGYSR